MYLKIQTVDFVLNISSEPESKELDFLPCVFNPYWNWQKI